ncbi:MAG: hypothetical protein R3C45_21250 [Phycisphaerales bacterium]
MRAVGELPVLFSGRFKPIDSVARNSLMAISGRQSFGRHGERIDAVTWLLDVIARPELARDYDVFRVDHPGVREMMGLSDARRKRFSYNTLMQRSAELQAQAALADETPLAQRDLFQNKVLQLSSQLSLYQALAGMHAMNLVPGDPMHQGWLPLHASEMNPAPQQSGIAESYRALLDAYKARDAVFFNQQAVQIHTALLADHRSLVDKASLEASFNHYGLFYRASLLYLANRVGSPCFLAEVASPLSRAMRSGCCWWFG